MIEKLAPTVVDKLYGLNAKVRQRVDDAAEQRASYLKEVAKLTPLLPELPDTNADTIYQQIETHEHALAPTDSSEDYGNGGATIDDEIWTANYGSGLLLSADHATDPVRKATSIREGADHGTGGLAMTLSDNERLSYVLPAGRQTGNANVDVTHPMKTAMEPLLPAHDSFVSVHGMKPGKFEHQLDDREIHAVVGLGMEPTEEDRLIAQRLITRAMESYGLKVVVGNDAHFFDTGEGAPRLNRDERGKPKYSAKLAALGAGSTTNFVRGATRNRLFPAMQIEISRTLRFLPGEMEYRETRQKVMAVYMGYLLARDLVTIVSESTATV